MRQIDKKRLGDLLVEAGKITSEQLKDQLVKQKTSGKRLGELLIEEGIITEDDIVNVLEMQLGIPRAYLDFITIEEAAVKTIPEGLAKKYGLIPIALEDDKLSVAMSDPMNIFALDDVRIASGYEIETLIATSSEIQRALDKVYTGQSVEKAAEELNKENERKQEADDRNEINQSVEEINNAPIVKLVDSMLKDAIKQRSSDIHIEPFEKYIKVRYRIDGELQEKQKLPIESLAALVTRIKILSNMNIAEKRIPQDGRMKIFLDGKNIDLRVSALPTIYGEKIVFRVLRNDNYLLGKEKLGMDDEDMNRLDSIIQNPYGIVLVTGPTGSGKSTTLYTLLNELNTSDKNIITVEDPVEYMLDGINQVNVNVKAGLTFAAGLRSILRQDPDIVMIGEIRDSETAEIAVRAAVTGHLVLSTIHTNDAPSSIVRLVDMGIQSYLAATSVAGIIAQRLVRRICPNCDEEYEASEYEKRILRIDESRSLRLHRGKGCQQCNDTGYLGRLGIYEIMEISQEVRNLIMKNAGTEEIRESSIKGGMKTLRVSCENLVLQGKTTVDELIKTVYIKE
ncbi:MAG: ATPase, T2SS/T4P/T4SS family [Bacillota bacterium]|nr:ATPase, T2SS/T4P/T4SS family [Bacillota bacterium]